MQIIAIKGIIPPPQKFLFKDVYIVYDLMDTNLHQIISSDPVLSEEHCQYLTYQILRGLKYMHSAKILHRDLKPSNLLLNQNCDLKICDFGLACVSSDTTSMADYIVTRWYKAPELLLNSSKYTTAIDVWSVGCILMELMDRRPLFPGVDDFHQLCMILQLIGTPSEDEIGFLSENAKSFIRLLPSYVQQSFTKRYPYILPTAIDLIEKMLRFDPTRRITVTEALEHPYLAALHDEHDEPIREEHYNYNLELFHSETEQCAVLSEEQMKDLVYREVLAYNP